MAALDTSPIEKLKVNFRDPEGYTNKPTEGYVGYGKRFHNRKYITTEINNGIIRDMIEEARYHSPQYPFIPCIISKESGTHNDPIIGLKINELIKSIIKIKE